MQTGWAFHCWVFKHLKLWEIPWSIGCPKEVFLISHTVSVFLHNVNFKFSLWCWLEEGDWWEVRRFSGSPYISEKILSWRPQFAIGVQEFSSWLKVKKSPLTLSRNTNLLCLVLYFSLSSNVGLWFHYKSIDVWVYLLISLSKEPFSFPLMISYSCKPVAQK